MPATVFDKPIFPGAKIVLATLTVENTSGSYSETVTDDRISASMKAYALEIDDPSIFGDKISVTAGAGEYTIECDDVAGSTTVKISFLKVMDDPTAVTSTEFDILENRIGDLDDLTTTAKTNVVGAVNEVDARLENLHDRKYLTIDVAGKTLNTAFTVPFPEGYSLSNCFMGSVSYYYGGSSNCTPGYQMFSNSNLQISVAILSSGITVTPIGQYSNYTGSKLYVELVHI